MLMCRAPQRTPSAAGMCNAQAVDGHDRPVWTVAYQIPHRDLTAISEFVVLSSDDGMALTLSPQHIVYVAAPATGRAPAAARDVQV